MRKLPPATRQWVISTTAILFIIFGTLLLVAFAQGYTFDPMTKKINANGLVLINSEPTGANIYINNKSVNKRTPFRYTNAPQGDIEVDLEKNDYRNWSAKQKVVARQVTFLDYAILLPNILTQNNINQDRLYNAVYQSTDKSKTIAFSTKPLSISNITDINNPKTIYAPQSNTENPLKNITALKLLQLSDDGNKLLLQQTLSDNTLQTVVISSNGSQIDNLTNEFGFDFKSLEFNQRDTNELFWLDGNNLKKIKINSKSISSNLVSDVVSYSVEKDRLLVAKPDTKDLSRSLIYSYDLNGQNERNIYSTNMDEKGYEMSFINSRYNEYLIVRHISNGLTQLVKNPYSQDQDMQQLESVISYTVNPNQRFLVLNQDNNFKTLDLEYNQTYSNYSSLENLQNWSWYDNYHLVLMQNNQLKLVDFDGQNSYTLTPLSDVSGYSINHDDKSILPLNNQGQVFKLWLTKK